MTEATRKLLDQALELDVEERRHLVDALYASLEAVPTDPIDASLCEELARRRREIDEGRVTLRPTTEVVADVRRQLAEMRTPRA